MIPSGNDSVTIRVMVPCPVCQTPFVPVGKRIYCSDTCRVAGHRRRRRVEQAQTPVTVPASSVASRRAITVYECDTCEIRQLGEQRCECGLFMRKLGPGGLCPHCDDIMTIDELLGR